MSRPVQLAALVLLVTAVLSAPAMALFVNCAPATSSGNCPAGCPMMKGGVSPVLSAGEQQGSCCQLKSGATVPADQAQAPSSTATSLLKPVTVGLPLPVRPTVSITAQSSPPVHAPHSQASLCTFLI